VQTRLILSGYVLIFSGLILLRCDLDFQTQEEGQVWQDFVGRFFAYVFASTASPCITDFGNFIILLRSYLPSLIAV